ncbi:MAG: symporter [Flavobacteriaceae bacterium]|nr:MAG: symporter [Flavobacteriaceae bacterium]
MIEPLDSLQVNFDAGSLWILNILIAIVMFGVALEIKTADFKRLFENPKILFTGVISQFILLPAITFLFVKITTPSPSIALGLLLVAACPGGNISNFMSHLAKGNSALSVSLTAFSTFLCLFMTPFNLQFWGNLYPPTAEILKSVELNWYTMLKIVMLIVGIPLIIGMSMNHYFHRLSKKIAKILKPTSFLIFLGFIGVIFYNNFEIFTRNVHAVLFLVIGHNMIALLLGYYFSKAMGLSKKNQKTIAIETGIQNAGLGLLLIFSFFEGLGGMALLAAFWGLWDIVSGLTIAAYWGRKTIKSPECINS